MAADDPAAGEGEEGVDSGELIDADKFFGIKIDNVRRKKEQASLGKFRLDIVTPPDGARWGQFNDRRVDTSWVLHLFNEFKGVLDNCIDATTIDVVVRRRWVGNLPKTFAERLQRVDNLESDDEVPVVEFTPEGVGEMPAEGLWIMGGNHRREALRMYVDDLESKLEDAKERASRLRKSANEGGNILATSAAAERAQLIAQELEKKIARSRLWVVNLYDKGESHTRVPRRRTWEWM